MQKVVVMNRQRAINMSYNDFAIDRVIISITNFETDPAVFNPNNHSIQYIDYYHFNDWDDGEDGCIEDWQAREIAETAMRFWNTDCQIVVHCDGGVSRSAGVAAAILKFFTGDDSQIFSNPQYYPNMLCYRKVLNSLMDLREEE